MLDYCVYVQRKCDDEPYLIFSSDDYEKAKIFFNECKQEKSLIYVSLLRRRFETVIELKRSVK